MSRSPAPPTLGECIKHRREQLRLSQAKAARLAGVARSTWIGWEKATLPDEANFSRIEHVCEWAPGSVAAVLAGLAPSTLGSGLATVTPLRPDMANVPLDRDELSLVEEWEHMELPDEFIAIMLADYRAKRAGLRDQYRTTPRRAAAD